MKIMSINKETVLPTHKYLFLFFYLEILADLLYANMNKYLSIIIKSS